MIEMIGTPDRDEPVLRVVSHEQLHFSTTRVTAPQSPKLMPRGCSRLGGTTSISIDDAASVF